jgi:hypothetical protein
MTPRQACVPRIPRLPGCSSRTLGHEFGEAGGSGGVFARRRAIPSLFAAPSALSMFQVKLDQP